MSTFIEARVIQKVATETEWMANPLKLYQGEVAYVSDKYNFKLNTTEIPKTFAELDYYYKGDIIGGVLPTDNLGSKQNGVYRATISGTYGGVVVKEGYYTLLRKKDDGSWILESEVKIPTQDLTPLENRITENENKVDDFIRDFAVTTDTEFNAESKNPISNSAVTPLANVLNGFLEDVLIPSKTVNLTPNDAVFGGKFLSINNTINTDSIYPNAGVIHNYNVELATKLTTKKIVAMSNAMIIGVKKDNSIIVLLNVSDPNLAELKVFDITDYKAISIAVDENSFAELKVEFEETIKKEINAKEYIDGKLIVLDSFLNPTTSEIKNISLPQAVDFNEKAIEGGHEISAPGFSYGLIPKSEFDGYDYIEISGGLNLFSGWWLWAQDNVGNIVKILVQGSSPTVTKINLKELPNTATKIGYSRYKALTKITVEKLVSLPLEKDSVLKAIENGVGSGSKISQQTKAKIAYPTNLIELNFETSDNLPTAKGTLAKGVLNYTDNAGTSFKKFATLEVQGASSAFHPKKNWTFALFNKKDYSDEFKLRIGNLAPHSEFVFKSNWIDATHCRNILSNKIWEDIVQSRKYFPKRENEVAYLASNTNVDQRFDSGALCHVDGMPAKLFVNGNFYGIGMFNIGKKRENYDLKSSNQNHIQFVAKTHANFYSYIPEQWEVRNPKTPDANFLTKINAWFASNALAGQTFKDNFETNHVLKNAIDFFLLAEFIQSPDMYTKNLILTSWDGVKFYFLPYDMDTTFGLQWDGASYTGHTTSIRSANFWQKFYSTYTVEIKARYKELRDNGVFTLENVYRHADKMNKTFGVDNFKEEFEKWSTVPSNSTIYTSYNQIYQWVKDRLIWLDSQYL